MRKILFIIAFAIPFMNYAQDTIVRSFSATITFSGMTLHSAGKYQGTLLVNDQSGKYRGTDVLLGDLVYTNSVNSYVVDTVISKTFTGATVRLRQTAGTAAIPSGVGYISRASKNYGVPFFTPDNQNGISSQLQAIAMSNLVYKLDSLVFSTAVDVDTIQLTGDVVGGIYNTMLDTLSRVRFNTLYNPAADTVGYLRWDSANGTLSLGLLGGNVVLQIGQEEVHRVRNDSGVNLVDGDIVYISGSQGDRPKVKKADADVEATSSVVFGVVTEPIASGADGFVTVSGYVKGVNTNGLTEGSPIWLDTIPGKFTSVKPKAPINSVLIGYVIKALNSGTIFVKVQNGYELEELHDVLITSPVNNSLLLYDSTARVWKDTAASTIIGSGTVNYISKWQAGGGLTNSSLVDSAGVVYMNKYGTQFAELKSHELNFNTVNLDGSNYTGTGVLNVLEWKAKIGGSNQAFARMYMSKLDSTGLNRYGRIQIGTGHNGSSYGGNQVVIQSTTQDRKQVILGDGYGAGFADSTDMIFPVVLVAGSSSFGRDLFQVKSLGATRNTLMSINSNGNTRFSGYTKIANDLSDVSAPAKLLDVRGSDQQLANFLRTGNGQASIVIGNNGFTPAPNAPLYTGPDNSEFAAIRVSSMYRSSTDTLSKETGGLLGIKFNKIGTNWHDTTNSDVTNLRYSVRLLTKSTDGSIGIFSVYPQGSGAVAIAQRLNVTNGDASSPSFGDTVSLGVSGVAHFSNKVRIAGSPNNYATLDNDLKNTNFFVKNNVFADAIFAREGGAAGITFMASQGTASSPSNVSALTNGVYPNTRYGAINTRYYQGGSYRNGVPIEFHTDIDTTFSDDSDKYKTGITFRNRHDGAHVLSIFDERVGINTSSPQYSLDMRGSDGIKIPSGASSAEPSTKIAGLLRFNTDTATLSYYDGTVMQSVPKFGTATSGSVLYRSGYTASSSSDFTYNNGNLSLYTITGTGGVGSSLNINNGLAWWKIGQSVNSNLTVQHIAGNIATNILHITKTAIGINTTSPSKTLHIEGEARISDLITDTPTRIVGADADGDLGSMQIDTSMIVKPNDVAGSQKLAVNHSMQRNDLSTAITAQTVKLAIGNTSNIPVGGFSSITKVSLNRGIEYTFTLDANYTNNIIDGSVHTIHLLITGTATGTINVDFPDNFLFEDNSAMGTKFQLVQSKLYSCYYDKAANIFYCNK